MDTVRSPTLPQVINAGLDTLARALRMGMPGKIVSFDGATQLANVKPLLPNVYEDETGALKTESIPELKNVPVQFPGGGGFAATFPVAAGDVCWLAFADRSLDIWKEKGGENDPVDLRRHALADAVAWVGLNAKPQALSEFDTSRAVWGKQGGKRIAATGSEVHLGVDHNESATEAAILGTTYASDENAMLNAIDTALTALEGELTTAATMLTTAATSNAIPIYGGAIALPQFAVVVSQLTLAIGQLAQIAAQLTQFVAKDATHKSLIVKAK